MCCQLVLPGFSPVLWFYALGMGLHLDSIIIALHHASECTTRAGAMAGSGAENPAMHYWAERELFDLHHHSNEINHRCIR